MFVLAVLIEPVYTRFGVRFRGIIRGNTTAGRSHRSLFFLASASFTPLLNEDEFCVRLVRVFCPKGAGAAGAGVGEEEESDVDSMDDNDEEEGEEEKDGAGILEHYEKASTLAYL